MNKLFIVITHANPQGFGGMESHFIAMVDYFRNMPDYSTAVIGIQGDSISFYDDLFKQWKVDVHNIIDPSNARVTKRRFLETITDNSIVYFNSPHWYGIFKEIKKRRKNCRIIIRSGGNDVGLPWGVEETFLERCRRLFFQACSGIDFMSYIAREKVAAINAHADTLITNSHYSTERSVDLGINRERLTPIVGGVDQIAPTRKIHEDKKELVVLNVSRMKKFKGLEYSIQAFSYAQQQSSVPLRMEIIGDGEEKEKIMRCAENLGVKGVTFLGKIPYPDVLGYFQKADIYLHMPIYQLHESNGFSFAHTETMGRSLIEASAAGLPIVATAVGGVSEIVKDGKSGFLVAEKDHVAAGEKILLLHDAGLRNKLGSFGRTLTEKEYSWEAIFDTYHALFCRNN